MLQQEQIESVLAMSEDIREVVVGASVFRAHKGKLFSRLGRGFSMGELAKAGLEIGEARRIGIRVDRRRRSTHEANVDLLKKHALDSQKSLGRTGARERSGSRSGNIVEAVEAAE